MDEGCLMEHHCDMSVIWKIGDFVIDIEIDREI